MNELIKALSSASDAATLTLAEVAVTIVAAIIFGIGIAVTYIKTQRARQYSQNFAVTLTLLPLILSVIILFIGSNIARAFSMAGVLSIIRFRSAPGDPKDIGYVFFDIGAGVACGVGQYFFGALFVAVGCMLILILSVLKFGAPKTTAKYLKVIIPEDLNYESALVDVLDKYTTDYKLVRVKTTDLGSLFELDYTVNMRRDVSEKTFIDELRCRNGNLNISLSLASAVEYGK